MKQPSESIDDVHHHYYLNQIKLIRHFLQTRPCMFQLFLITPNNSLTLIFSHFIGSTMSKLQNQANIRQKCQVCISNNTLPRHCGCFICIDCLIEWFNESSAASLLTTINSVKCPSAGCEIIFTSQQIVDLCETNTQKQRLSEGLLKLYLRKSDIRPCPSSKCNVYGFLPSQSCEDELQCTTCDFKWRDVSILPYHVQMELEIEQSWEQLRSFGYYFFKTKRCPGCACYIEKNGGCKHMTCSKCQNQHCWECQQVWNQHKNNICSSRLAFLVFMSFYLAIVILQRCLLFHYLSYLAIPALYIVFIVNANVYVGLCLASGMYFLYSLAHPVLKGTLQLQGIYPIFGLLQFPLICGGYTLLSDLFNEYMGFSFYSYFWILAAELIFIFGLVSLYFYNYTKWLLIPIAILLGLYFYTYQTILILLGYMPLLFFHNDGLNARQTLAIHFFPYFINFLYTGFEVPENFYYVLGVDVFLTLCAMMKKDSFRRNLRL